MANKFLQKLIMIVLSLGSLELHATSSSSHMRHNTNYHMYSFSMGLPPGPPGPPAMQRDLESLIDRIYYPERWDFRERKRKFPTVNDKLKCRAIHNLARNPKHELPELIEARIVDFIFGKNEYEFILECIKSRVLCRNTFFCEKCEITKFMHDSKIEFENKLKIKIEFENKLKIEFGNIMNELKSDLNKLNLESEFESEGLEIFTQESTSSSSQSQGQGTSSSSSG